MANSVEDSEFVNLSMSEFEGVLYFFHTTRGSLRKAPKWNASVEFPPLSPRRAQEAAWNRARQMRPDVSRWYRDSISLHPFGKSLYLFDTDTWFYLVRFSRADVPTTGLPFFLDVPVLMDGRALTPSVGPLKTATGPSKGELLVIWRAPDTPIEQRLFAARSLLTPNMHTDEVEALLGEPTMRNRYNPGRLVGAPELEHPRISWYYDYRFKDGTVSVSFLQVMNVDRFEAEFQSVGLSRAGG